MGFLSIFTSLLSKDDWIYTGILLLSFALGWGIRKSGNIWLLKNVCGATGFIMATIVLGTKIIQSIILVVFVTLCIKYVKKQLPLVVFVGTFVYLMILRNIHYVLDVNELASQANVVQLIMTLRVIGLTYEINDARENRKKTEEDAKGKSSKDKKEAKPKRYLKYEPSLFETFDYFYHFAGLFTGPYYTYQMYLDSHNETLFFYWSPIPDIKYRLVRLLWSVPIFVVVNKLYPLDGLRSDAIWEICFSHRLVYAAAVFVVFRMRVYSAWAIAESICVTLGLGIYPVASSSRCVVGPTKLDAFKELHGKKSIEYNSEAMVNLDIREVELSDGFRSGVRAWNRSVQSWLAIYVHSRANRKYNTELTMFVSALWHGTYAGYFMSFLIVPMCFGIEEIIFSYVPKDKETGERPKWFRWFYWATLRSRGFDMLATGFLLKNFAHTHRYWSSLYYWLLLITLPIYAFDKYAGKKREKMDKKTN